MKKLLPLSLLLMGCVDPKATKEYEKNWDILQERYLKHSRVDSLSIRQDTHLHNILYVYFKPNDSIKFYSFPIRNTLNGAFDLDILLTHFQKDSPINRKVPLYYLGRRLNEDK